MTGTLLVGGLLLAYGPSAALLLLYVSRRSALLVIAVLAAFVWLLATLVAGLAFVAAPPALRAQRAYATLVGVACQEAARLLLAHAYARGELAAESVFRRLRDGGLERAARRAAAGEPAGGAGTGAGDRLSNDLAAAISAGVGFGLMHTVVMFGAALTAAGGDAAWFRDSCPGVGAFAATAATALFTSALHVPLTVLALDAYRRWSAPRALASPTLYVLFALAGLLAGDACRATLPLQAAAALAAAALAARVVAAPDFAATLQTKQWREDAASHAEALRLALAAGAEAQQLAGEARSGRPVRRDE